MKIQEGEARLIKIDGHLGKRVIKFDVPIDFIEKTKNGSMMVGIGKWINTDKNFVCFAKDGKATFIEKDTFLKIAENLINQHQKNARQKNNSQD